MAALEWIPIETPPSIQDVLNHLDRKYLVIAWEFDSPHVMAICNCWISTDQPKLVKWYLDRMIYQLPNLQELAPEVHYYLVLPDLPEIKMQPNLFESEA